MRRAIRSSRELLEAVGLPQTEETTTDFPVLAPWPLVQRIQHGDASDPILRQLLSTPEELLEAPGFVADPLQEAEASPAPGVIHKYSGRALLIITGACALHCRYCFRRSFPYSEHAQGRLQDAFAYLHAHSDIHEVILSGGDPLSVDDARLATVLDALEQIPHLRTLRIHTRLPIAIPQRVTPLLLQRLRESRLRCVVVVHSNHAREISPEVQAALEALQTVAMVLNQAVLLRGVNDSVHAQEALSHALFAAGVLPYYLHQLDPVRGATHFAVDDDFAVRLHQDLRDRLPGYLLPRLVREIPGKGAKHAVL